MRWDDESVGRPALPLGELVQPWPIAAMVVLAINDHVLKGAGILPAWVTGKLSDFAGLFFFPLLCTALVDTLLALVRAPIDPTLRLGKALAACALTAIGFLAIELSPAAAAAYAQAVSTIGVPSESTADPTDLSALAVLPLAYLVARRHVRRVPYGRVAWALRSGNGDGVRKLGFPNSVPISEQFVDVARLARSERERALVAELVTALEDGSAGRADAALAAIRGRKS